jgi:hypothetical protein
MMVPAIGAVEWRRVAPVLSLVVACLALSGLIAAEWLRWQDSAGPPAPPPASPVARPAATLNFTMPGLATFAEVLSRPLFSATRHPDEAAPVVQNVSSNMTLIAILISPRGPHALVRHGTPAQLDRVVEGQIIDGWTAEAIKDDRIIFRRGDDVLELVPASAPQPPQPHPPQTPATPPVPQAPPGRPPPRVGL